MSKARINRWVVGAVISGAAFAALPAGGLGQAGVTPPTVSPLVQARKQVAEAQADWIKAKAELDATRKRVEAAFGRTNPGYAAAQRTYLKAEQDVKTGTQAALDALGKNPDYQATLAAAKAAKEKRDKLLADPKSNPDDVTAAANEVYAQVTAQKKMEADAVNTDPKLIEAKQRLADSKQQLDDLKSKLDEACAADPQYAAAAQQEAAAQQRVEQAKASLAQQAKAQAEAEAAAARARAAAAHSSGSGATTPPRPTGR